jgi:hypothetical protein
MSTTGGLSAAGGAGVGTLVASALVVSLLVVPPAGAVSSAPAGAAPAALAPVVLRPSVSLVPGTSCPLFPADSWWHADVSRLPVNSRSRQWLAATGAAGRRLHPDFGPSFGAQPVPYGIPVTVVRAGTARVAVRFGYADESDRVRYPLSRTTKIEGGPNAGGDRHAIVVDAGTCTLFETWDTHRTATGWYAGSGAVWSLRSNRLRPAGWTSADAAGLPILPGLLRYDEVAAGRVDHAIRFTVPTTSRAYVWPARHQAGSTADPRYPPMGARFRLKASYPVRGYTRAAAVVLVAMKRYGMVVADNGSPWFFQGTSDTRWPAALVDELKKIPASAFEAVDTRSLKISTSSMAVRH